jgi:MscS family membrane protein
LPNGQIANMKVETLSARDKFPMHPVLGLRYGTTPGQLRSVISGLRNSLGNHTNIDSASVRVQFIRFGAYSLDVDVFAYVFALDWSEFLQIQEELLFEIMGIVHGAGSEIAFPSQTLYLDRDKLWDAIAQHNEPAEVLGTSRRKRAQHQHEKENVA